MSSSSLAVISPRGLGFATRGSLARKTPRRKSFVEGAPDSRVEVAGETPHRNGAALRRGGAGARRVLAQQPLHGRRERRVRESPRLPPAQELEEGHAERVDVRGGRDRSADELLRR